jgi:hypothetical protein
MNMKKLSALLVFLLGLLPTTAAMADTEPCQKNTNTGNVSNVGAVTALNLNPVFTGYTPSVSFCSGCGGTSPMTLTMQTDISLKAEPVLVNSNFAAIQITGFAIQCATINSPIYGGETNGVAGGTVTIHEYKPTGSPVVVGTVVLPSSPHNGPYVNFASSKLNTPYTPTKDSTFDAQITSFNAVPSVAYGLCEISALLQ